MKTDKIGWLLPSLVLVGIFLFVAAYFNRVEAGNSVNFFWRAEGTTLDPTHDFSVGDTTATLNSTAAINTDAARIGTNGLDIPSSSDHYSFVISSGDLMHPGTASIALWFRIVTFGGSFFSSTLTSNPSTNITAFLSGTDDATGREVTLRNRLAGNLNVTLSTTAADLALNTWYFLVARYDEPNNDRRIEIYNSDGSLRTAVEDLTTDFAQATGIDNLAVGEATGATADLHLDNIFIADDYNEPLQNKMNITSWTEYESTVFPKVEVKGGVRVRGGVNFR